MASGKFPDAHRALRGLPRHGVRARSPPTSAFLLRARREGLRDFGACMAPMTAFQILQGLETLPLRMARHVAEHRDAWSSSWPRTRRWRACITRDLGEPSRPRAREAALSRRAAARSSPSSSKGGRDAGRKFIEALTLFSHLANIGDAKSLVIHPASTTHFRMDDAALAAAGITPRDGAPFDRPRASRRPRSRTSRGRCAPRRDDAVHRRRAIPPTPTPAGGAFDPALPAIVFIHGAALDHSVWQWQSRYLAHHGFARARASTCPATGAARARSRASIEALADWVAAFIEAAGVRPGPRRGPQHGLADRARHRASPSGARRDAGAPRRRGADAGGRSLPRRGAGRLARGVRHAGGLGPRAPVRAVGERRAGHRRSRWPAGSSRPARTRACNTRTSRPATPIAPSRDAIRELKVPTLVVAGRRDQMTPLKAGQALAKDIPGARFVTVDSGHSMMSEAPREVLAALRLAFA